VQRRWWLAMGGNLGDVAATLTAAETQLAAHPQIQLVASSRRYRTAPVGADAGTAFLNSAVEIETDLEPLDLLDYVQGIENGLGRVRTLHWGPRTLDIDLLFAKPACVMTTERLALPHLHLWYRRFVLEPLNDIARDVVIEPYAQSVNELASLWRQSDWSVGVYSSTNPTSRDAIIDVLTERFAQRTIEAWIPGQPRPELLAVIGDPTGIKPLFLILPDNIPAATQALTDAITAAQDQPVPMS
jgi:2-amino-4-hydroxy-6-hydroxymethyldihydropteridine diphosphokinase